MAHAPFGEQVAHAPFGEKVLYTSFYLIRGIQALKYNLYFNFYLTLPARRRARALHVRRRARAPGCILSMAMKGGGGNPMGPFFLMSGNLKKRIILDKWEKQIHCLYKSF